MGRRPSPEPGWEEQHVTPDVALGFWEYQMPTGDQDFLADGTWPVLRGVSEWIESRGVFTARGFEIEPIMGPDEGAEDVDNSSYVNVICRMVLEAAVRCASLVGARPPNSWAKIARGMVIPVDETRNIVLPYDHPQQGRLYSLGNMAMVTVHDPPLDVQLLKETYKFEKELRSPRPPGIGFGEDAETAMAALFGDRREAARLFSQSWENVWVEPYGMIKEAPSEDYAFSPTSALCFRQQCWVSGASASPIPDGRNTLLASRRLDGVEIERVWMNGSPRRLLARNGEQAKLLQE